MPNAFKAGDVVQLKSGGPRMTVVEYRSAGSGTEVLCQWFSEKQEVQAYTFPEALLASSD